MKNDVVGIDPSMTATGIAYFDDTITVTGCQGDDRLVSIRDAVTDICEGARLVVIELLPQHMKSAGITGMVHGVIRVALLDLGVDYLMVPPAVLKKYATGMGQATKPDMRMALFKRTGLDLRDDNQVDAYWLRALGLDLLGEPIVEVPSSHRGVLSKLRHGAAA